MPGKLENRTRTALTFNLTTKVAPLRRVFSRREESRDGAVRTVDRRVVFPDSITILARSTSEDLPDGVPHCPEVAKAIASGKVKWHPGKEPAAAKRKVDAPAAPEADGVDPSSEAPRARQRPAGPR